MNETSRTLIVGLTVAACFLSGRAMHAATVAYWRFETDSGAAVTNNQGVVRVDDASGNGWSLTNVAGATGSKYGTNISHAVHVPRTGEANRFMGQFSGTPLKNSGFNAVAATNCFTVEMFFRSVIDGGGGLLKLGNMDVSLAHSTTGIAQFRWTYPPYWDDCPPIWFNLTATHHMAVVNNNGAYRLYLDGALIDSQVAPSNVVNAGIALGDSGPSVRYIGDLDDVVGRLTRTNGTLSSGRYAGSLDEVRVSNVALRPGEFLNAPRRGAADTFAGPPIFDWGARSCWYDPPINAMVLRTDGVRNCPFPGVPGGDYPVGWEAYYAPPHGFYPQMFASNYPLAMMMSGATAPLSGSNPGALATVATKLAAGGLRLNFVFADFELGTVAGASEPMDHNDFRIQQDFWECSEMVRQVRSSADTNVNSAYVGCYPYYPGNRDPGAYPWSTNHTVQSEIYLNSGLDCAMPDCYPYAFLDQHTLANSGGPAGAPSWGTNTCQSIRDALFYEPLEKLSEARRNLPAGHKLIPFIGGFCAWDGYSTNAPPKVDTQALVIHYRLRGVDGYYSMPYYQACGGTNVPPAAGYYNASTYLSDGEYIVDMLKQWRSLDDFFAMPGATTLLNLDTVKTAAIHWSGAIRGQTAKVIVSNLSTNSARVQYPGGHGLPPYSDDVPAGQHRVFDYNLPLVEGMIRK